MKKKILDVRIPKEEQEKSEPLKKELKKKKWQVTFENFNGKIRYAYCDDPETVEEYLKNRGATIWEVVKND